MSRVISFIKYLWHCNGRHGVHSPFVYQLLEDGLYIKNNDFKAIQQLRKELRKDNTPIRNNFGTNAGAYKGQGTIGDLAKKAGISHRYGTLLAKLVKYFNPEFILELGTSLGISSAYMAQHNVQITTVEGNDKIASYAKSNHQKLGLDNLEVVCSDFDTYIDQSLRNIPSIPFLYLDGDHSYEATMRYFSKLKSKATSDSVFVFDDIYWSPGMTKAWEEIKQDEIVTLSLDFYKMGVVFFKPVKEKQHFRIWY
ncbi:O-methyltransferase [Luteibaculum oceani]|uniref:O-methyltransferase n=1 Tax=Luteibaculum oceani TaxID=1294296 RepID=UPI0014777E4F|nr:class I SAM-dependent methyltransferase [Luteibaculum oceani]